MRRILVVTLVCVLLLSLAACSGEKEPDDLVGEYQPPEYSESTNGPNTEIDLSHLTPEALAWRNKVLESPLIAEVEHYGVQHQVHIYERTKYTYNTKTGELLTGSTVGDLRATVLKDWISPYNEANLDPEDALFQGCWENTGTRSRAFLGYLNTAQVAVRVDLAGEIVEIFGLIDGPSFFTAPVRVVPVTEKVYITPEVDEKGEAIPEDMREYEEITYIQIQAERDRQEVILFDKIDVLPDTEVVVKEANFELVTRARTAEYLEYIYKDVRGKHYRVAFTDDFILFSELAFMYIFDMGNY